MAQKCSERVLNPASLPKPLNFSQPHVILSLYAPNTYIWYSKKGGSNCFPQECSIWPTIFLARVGWCAQSMRAPVAVLNESFLSDAFAGREGQTPPFKGRAHAAPTLLMVKVSLTTG
jgi:hypothetical protein